MPGSWRPGRRIATSPGSAGRPGCRSPSARCCGRSSNGSLPTIRVLKSEREEIKTVGGWLAERAKGGVAPHEVGLFVRSRAQLDRAKAAAKEAGLPFKVLDERVETAGGHVSVSTMHLA